MKVETFEDGVVDAARAEPLRLPHSFKAIGSFVAGIGDGIRAARRCKELTDHGVPAADAARRALAGR